MTNAELKKEFDSLPNDAEKWLWVQQHQSTGIIIYLDNDDTHGILPDEDDPDDCIWFQFDYYIGWAKGLESLLEAMGIKAEEV